MGRKHKLLKSFADLNLENSVRPKNQSSRTSIIVPPPSLCHGSESCGCFCHYAENDPPPCYSCCQPTEQSDDFSLAHKVLLGKKDSLSKGKSNHFKDYVLHDEFGFEIPKYRKKRNKKLSSLSNVLDGENSSKPVFNAKDSLRLNRECSINPIEDLVNIENLLIAANKSVTHHNMVNNISNGDSRHNRMLRPEDIARRISLQHYAPTMSIQNPSQCRRQVKRSESYVIRDNFGLEPRENGRAGCTIS